MKAKQYIFLSFFLFSIKGFSQEAAVPVSMADSNSVKRLFFAGLREKLNDNYALASVSFNKILSLDPKNDAALYELANADMRMNKLDDAERNIKQALKLSDNKWYWSFLGELYKRKNQWPQLENVLSELIRLDPQNEIYYFNKANAQLLASKIDEANATYLLIEQKFGDSKQLANAKENISRNTKLSESELLKLLESNKASVKDYLYAAGLLLEKKNDAEALKVLKRAQKIEPDNFEVNLSIADIYRQQRNDEAAFSALNLAFGSEQMPLNDKIKIIISIVSNIRDPKIWPYVNELSRTVAQKHSTDAKALALYGDVLAQQNKLNEALVQYQQSLKINDQIYSVWEQIVNVHALLGQYKEAQSVGEEALTLYPNQAKLYYFVAYSESKLGKTDQALSHLSSATQLDADNTAFTSQVYALEGDIYLNKNNFPLAKKAFEKSIATDPENYLVMNNYAYYLALRDDDLDKAEKLASTAVNAMPNSASIADTYAYILFKQKKYALAQKWIEKTLQNNSAKNGIYLERYGDILYMQGEKDKALVEWLKAKEAGNVSEILNKKINEKKYFK